MSSLTLGLITAGTLLTILLLAVLGGEAVYRWVVLPTLHKYVGKGPKAGIFELGERTVSEGVELVMEKIGSAPVVERLERHRIGDWGEVDDENRRLNDLSLKGRERCGFESAYTVEDGTVLRILTHEDRSGTLLLTEEEYHQDAKLYVRPLMECLAAKEAQATTQAGDARPQSTIET